MTIYPNAFSYFGLTPAAGNTEILQEVMRRMKSEPENMSEIALNQKLLLNPASRFLIEFLYYLEPLDKNESRSKCDDSV